MVKKLVLRVQGPHDCNGDESISELLLLNGALLDLVTSYKDKITEYYKSRLWDKYKKLSNEYEHIFYSPNAQCNIALYNPVSRSFFKLWEVLHDFKEVINHDQPTSMKCVFLAEGPGGFFEAFHKIRKDKGYDKLDKYYGITLKSNNNRNIPDWKMNDKPPIHISYGKDGTGNLYDLVNIEYFAEEVGRNSVDFITADGGFDFSSDFNNQEEQSFRLIVCEVLSTLLLQKIGGGFLLKVYDCFNRETLMLLHILKACYDDLYFIKPLTSRPANSERYILCCGFNDNHQKYIPVLKNLVSQYDNLEIPDIQKTLNTKLSYDMLYYIVLYNMYYTIRQVYYIQRTINYINFFKKQQEDSVLNVLLEKHTIKSKNWCLKYHIPCKENISKDTIFL